MKIILFLISLSFISAQRFVYTVPENHSILNNKTSKIILKSDNKFSKNDIHKNKFIVRGNLAGDYKFDIIFPDERNTIILVPLKEFLPNEKVTLIIKEKITGFDYTKNQEILDFRISPLNESIFFDPINRTEVSKQEIEILFENLNSKISKDTLPPNFPPISVPLINNPSPGAFFLSNRPVGSVNDFDIWIIILGNDGVPVKYEQVQGFGNDFKMQPNGFLSRAYIFQAYNGYAHVEYWIMDNDFNHIDTYQMGNGYIADLHEFVILNNGNALMIGYDPQKVDMSKIIVGGYPDATVVGGIIQELDKNKNVVFQWRSWDHIPITDTYNSLKDTFIDYCHLNAVEQDIDGNILASFRTTSQVIKISRQTGEIIWRLGGKQNDFEFVNDRFDSLAFSYQHDVRITDKGNLTLFDNGNQHSPNYSRAVEYKIDELSKTAEMIWEFDENKRHFGFAMGSARRLPGGNTIIGWGTGGVPSDKPVFSEVNSNGEVVFEAYLPEGYTSYRVFKFPWLTDIPLETSQIHDITLGDYVFDNTGITISAENAEGTPNYITVSRYRITPYNMTFETISPILTQNKALIQTDGFTDLDVKISFFADSLYGVVFPERTIVYHRSSIGSGILLPLETTYDFNDKSLSVEIENLSEINEFVFGIPDTIDSVFPPLQLYPDTIDDISSISSLNLIVNPIGITDSIRFQVASDTNFTNIVLDSVQTSSLLRMHNRPIGSKLFWKVSAFNHNGESSFSDIRSFTINEPKINIIKPIEGDIFRIGATIYVIYEDNIDSAVVFGVYKNGLIIQEPDTVQTITGIIQYNIPIFLEPDTSYQIIISSVLDKSIYASTGNITFTDQQVGIIGAEVTNDFILFDNFPNPFNPSTNISFTIPEKALVTVKIFNILGEVVDVPYSQFTNEGMHNFTFNADGFSSGVYLINISYGKFTQTKKMVLMR